MGWAHEPKGWGHPLYQTQQQEREMGERYTLTKKQRATRDKLAVSAALHLAHDSGEVAGIAVDDDERAEVMLERLVLAAGLHAIVISSIIRRDGLINVFIGGGTVRIISVDRLVAGGGLKGA